MKNFKKLLCTIISVLMLLSIVGCGKKNDELPEVNGNQNTITESDKTDTDSNETNQNNNSSTTVDNNQDNEVSNNVSTATDEDGLKIKKVTFYYSNTDYQKFDKKIIDMKVSGDHKYYLTNDGSLYQSSGISNLELIVENTGLSKINYLDVDYKVMFAIDEDHTFIIATRENTEDLFAVTTTGKLKDTQQIYHVALFSDGEVNLDVYDTSDGNVYDSVSNNKYRSAYDFNEDGNWYYDPSFMAPQPHNGHVKQYAGGWMLDDEGHLFIHDSGSSHQQKETPDYLQQITFKYLIGENDTRFARVSYVYAVSENNELYVLRPADSDYSETQQIRLILNSIEEEILSATYDSTNRRVVVQLSDGYYYNKWDYTAREYEREQQLVSYDIVNEKINDIVEIIDDYIIMKNGTVYEVTKY